ncbi:MAG: arginine--tRNA ligase [Planctomycetaceae bacterium]|nr:arginine--tRNA ligase [Planctomycetaceae bacterium]
MNFLAELKQRISQSLESISNDAVQFAGMVKPTTDPKFGDFQANCAMPLAKLLNKPALARALAEQIVSGLDVSDLCEPPEIAGPGFINFKLKDVALVESTTALVNDDRLGVTPVTNPQKYIVDFSAPNVAKPMHVGHLRSSVLGDSLCRLLRFAGHEVVGDNHIGDWGTQFGMILFGYKNFLDRDALQRDMVGELARLYRLVNQLSDFHETRENLPKLDQLLSEKLQQLAQVADRVTEPKQLEKQQKKLRQEAEDVRQKIGSSRKKLDEIEADPILKGLADKYPRISVEARLETAKLHSGDQENLRLWNEFVPACLKAIQGIYDRLDVTFDLALGESFYQPMLGEVVADLKRAGMATESDGAICVFIPGNDAPFIIQKTDGAFTYATTDLATIKYRVETLKADAILYVVDTRQSEHFKLLFETARRWGFDKVQMRHVNFGTILGEDGRPFKTRSGDTVGLESLLDEAIAEAGKIVASNIGDDEQETAQSQEKLAQVAEIIGLGGIKYADLKHNRESDYVFSWEKMLAKNGDTATYMQYAYARVCGIVRKGGVDRQTLRNLSAPLLMTNPAERALMLQLNRFPEAIAGAIEESRPNLLAEYLYRTADLFTAFYENCPVQKAESDELRNSRLKLCDLTARILEKGLGLMGIRTVDQM